VEAELAARTKPLAAEGFSLSFDASRAIAKKLTIEVKHYSESCRLINICEFCSTVEKAQKNKIGPQRRVVLRGKTMYRQAILQKACTPQSLILFLDLLDTSEISTSCKVTH
jgi:cytochrome c2